MRHSQPGLAYVRPAVFAYRDGHDEIGDAWAAEARTAGTAALASDVWGVALLAWHRAGPAGRARMRTVRDAARAGRLSRAGRGDEGRRWLRTSMDGAHPAGARPADSRHPPGSARSTGPRRSARSRWRAATSRRGCWSRSATCRSAWPPCGSTAGTPPPRPWGAPSTAQLGPLRPARTPPLSTQPVTAVVATRGRANSLARCVRSILAGDHPAITVLVVDNEPDDDRTAQAVGALADPRRALHPGAAPGRVGRPQPRAVRGRPRRSCCSPTTTPRSTARGPPAWPGAFADGPDARVRERAGARRPARHRAGARRRHRAGLEQGVPGPPVQPAGPAARLRDLPVLAGAVRHRRQHGGRAPSSRGPRAGSTKRSARARRRTAARTASS